MEVQQSTDQPQHQQSSLIEWAVGRHTKKEQENPLKTNELHKTEIPIVKATPSGILVALVDGVGQGQAAADAARRVAGPFEEYTHQTLVDLFARADKSAQGTNGVAVTGAMFNVGFNTISWLGVGHVHGVLYRRSPAADPRFHKLERISGLLGTGSVRLRELCLPIKPGDLLLFATEGMSDDFVEALPIDGKPRVVADTLMAKYCAPDSECAMIVVRYLGLP
jgi:serine/threonine protein phosphatase PrpC